jgi:SAM-dependent methyltransferase
MGADIAGIEPSADNIKRLRADKISCYHGTVESVDLDEKFDIVTILWTLENCSDCIGFLKKARTFLKPDGHLVVATGSRILVPFKKNMGDYFSDNPADTHCFRFSSNSLARAMSLAGLEPAMWGRYYDSDWLIGSGVPYKNAFDRDDLYDDPKEVLKFFNNWRKMWP